jgi:hypothetical protein
MDTEITRKVSVKFVIIHILEQYYLYRQQFISSDKYDYFHYIKSSEFNRKNVVYTKTFTENLSVQNESKLRRCNLSIIVSVFHILYLLSSIIHEPLAFTLLSLSLLPLTLILFNICDSYNFSVL